MITVTVDTGGIDAAAARTLAERSRALGAHRAPPGGCARRLLRAGAALSHHGQRAPRPALPAVRRRRARHAGADHRPHGPRARLRHGRARLHRGRQRPGALRSRAAHARSGPARCSRRCATRPSSGRTSSTTCSARGLPLPPSGAKYSVNRGLWGVTIGGKETLTSAGSIPDDAWVLTRDAFAQPRPPERHAARVPPGTPAGARWQGRFARWRSSRRSRRLPHPSASAAAFTSATPSSAPRGASPSRHRRRRCCSARTASSRSSC